MTLEQQQALARVYLGGPEGPRTNSYSALCCAARALAKAHTASLKDGRVRYIVPTALGPKIALQRLPWTRCLWTNGEQAGYWEPDEIRGVAAMNWDSTPISK